MSMQHHERIYRTDAAMERMRAAAVTVCGAGALGANVVENLARAGFAALRVVDRDRVEEKNLSTQPYFRSDVGAFKARILANGLYRAVGVGVDARTEELTPANARKLLGNSRVVVDAFDNSGSRRAVAEWCAAEGVACLHAGLADGFAEVIWNEDYRVPSDANDDVCDYPLARNLAVIAAAIACESVVRYVVSGERESFTLTLGDMAIGHFG